MTRGEPDVLDAWLSGEGLAALNRITARSPDVLGVIDREYVIRWVNWTTPGLARESVIGTSALGLIPPDDKENARAAFDLALREGKSAKFEMFYRGE